MEAEVLIGVAGLVLAVLLSVFTYFAGVRRTEKRLRVEEKQNRIRVVFEKYMEFRRRNYTGGFDGLQKAGAATLESDSEIRELADLIVKHGENDPLDRKCVLFDSVDFKAFFDYSVEERVNFLRTPVEEIVEKSQKKA
jgi:hypothetical protein